jgi:hypothetical protein
VNCDGVELTLVNVLLEALASGLGSNMNEKFAIGIEIRLAHKETHHECNEAKIDASIERKETWTCYCQTESVPIGDASPTQLTSGLME